MTTKPKNNMEVYERVRTVPKEALKPIHGGRLKGMSDINPMWRIKMLTEVFGLCGIGWKTEITDKRIQPGAGEEMVCFVDILLYVKVDGEWSAPIPGLGGSSFIASEKNGLYTSDECFKMAYTDAISVACKALGFAADVYYANDNTKYTQPAEDGAPQAPAAPQAETRKPSQSETLVRQLAGDQAPSLPPAPEMTMKQQVIEAWKAAAPNGDLTGFDDWYTKQKNKRVKEADMLATLQARKKPAEAAQQTA